MNDQFKSSMNKRSISHFTLGLVVAALGSVIIDECATYKPRIKCRLADRYCPPSVDPAGNRNWKRNIHKLIK